MARGKRNRTAIVPRLIFGTICAAGVIPASMSACSGDGNSSSQWAVGAGGFSVAASGFGGFGGAGGQDAGTDAQDGQGGNDGSMQDGPDLDQFSVAQLGFIVPAPINVKKKARGRARRSRG